MKTSKLTILSRMLATPVTMLLAAGALLASSHSASAQVVYLPTTTRGFAEFVARQMPAHYYNASSYKVDSSRVLRLSTSPGLGGGPVSVQFFNSLQEQLLNNTRRASGQPTLDPSRFRVGGFDFVINGGQRSSTRESYAGPRDVRRAGDSRSVTFAAPAPVRTYSPVRVNAPAVRKSAPAASRCKTGGCH